MQTFFFSLQGVLARHIFIFGRVNGHLVPIIPAEVTPQKPAMIAIASSPNFPHHAAKDRRIRNVGQARTVRPNYKLCFRTQVISQLFFARSLCIGLLLLPLFATMPLSLLSSFAQYGVTEKSARQNQGKTPVGLVTPI